MSMLRLLLLAVAATGCVSIPLGSARTLDKGKFQLQAAQLATFFEGSGIYADGTPYQRWEGYTNVDLGLLYGVTDRVESGARLIMIGGPDGSGAAASLSAKFALLRAPGRESGVDLAVAPSVGLLGRFGKSTARSGSPNGDLVTTLQLPLLMGLNFPGGNQAIFGLSATNVYVGGGGSQADAVTALASVGFSWKVVDGLRFVPQMAYGHLWQVLDIRPAGTPKDDRFWMSQVGQVSLGFLLGGD